MTNKFQFVAACFLVVTSAVASSPSMPTFFARRDYPGLYTYYIQVADTNGDGIPDLIAADEITDGSGFKVLFGNGDGTFRQGPTSSITDAQIFGFLPGDLNGDGKMDLIVAIGSGILISFGNGDGTFQTGVFYQANDNVENLVLGDFNGDGIPDIATPGNSGLWLLTGQGGGTFNPAVLEVSLAGGLNIASADFNQDGKLDVAVTLPLAGTSGNGFAVVLGNGNGTFQAPQMFTTIPRPLAINAITLTKGGPPSIALSDTYTNDVYLYYGNGKGAFEGPRTVSLPGASDDNGFVVGDVNGDGIQDLVSKYGYVAYGEGDGYFTKPYSYPIEAGEQIGGVVLADLRNKGETDIVTGGYDAISVLLNLGKGFIEDGIWTSVMGASGCGAAADFNRDGKPDLAVNTSSGVSILLGTGKYLTPYSAGTSITLSGASCMVTGDLNGDGIPDLLVPVNGTVNAYLGVGNGTFTLTSTTPTPSSGFLALGDFNHDGKLDFATSGNLIALGNGDGTFQNPTNIVASSLAFTGIAVGDINNDGWPDIVLITLDLSENTGPTVLLNNQHGGFTQVSSSLNVGGIQPILVDLNGDGKLDLVIGNGGARLYLGDGKGDFTPLSSMFGVEPDQSGGTNAVADVNGDGIPDLLVAQSDTIEIYLGMPGTTYATPFAIGTGPSPGSLLVENLHGQSATAGIPDIVAPDSSGGVMVIFNLTQ